MDSHQRLSDVADNTVVEAQVISSYANQIDYGCIWRTSYSNVAACVQNGSSGTNSIGFDNNLGTGSAFNEEHFHCSAVASGQSACVQGVARTQNDAVASAESGCCCAADAEIIGCSNFSEVENITFSGCRNSNSSAGQVSDRDFVKVSCFECVQLGVSQSRLGVQREELINNNLGSSDSGISGSCFNHYVSCSSVSFGSSYICRNTGTAFSGSNSAISSNDRSFFRNRVNCSLTESRQLLQFSDQSGFDGRAIYRVQGCFQSSLASDCIRGSWRTECNVQLSVSSCGTSGVQRRINSGQCSRSGCNCVRLSNLSGCLSGDCWLIIAGREFVSVTRNAVTRSTNLQRTFNSSSVTNQSFLSSNGSVVCALCSNSCGARSGNERFSVKQVGSSGSRFVGQGCSSFGIYSSTSGNSKGLNALSFNFGNRTVFVGIESCVSTSGGFFQSSNFCLNSCNLSDQSSAWSQTWQCAVADVSNGSVNGCNRAVHANQNRSGGSRVVSSASSVSDNPHQSRPRRYWPLAHSRDFAAHIPPPSHFRKAQIPLFSASVDQPLWAVDGFFARQVPPAFPNRRVKGVYNGVSLCGKVVGSVAAVWRSGGCVASSRGGRCI